MSHRHAAADEHADERRHQAGRQEHARGEAQDDAREGDGVGQQVVLEIDGKQHDQRAGEQQPDDEQRVPAEDRPMDEEDGHCGELQRRVADRDAAAALAAAAAEQQIADDGNVVVPAQDVAAVRAARRRPDERLAARQAVDADVEKAADRQPEQGQQRDVERLDAHWMCSVSSGIGQSGDAWAT